MQHPRPEDLTNPAVVIAFSGWNDAANAASDALLHLMEHYPSSELETIDDEHYFAVPLTGPGSNGPASPSNGCASRNAI